MKNDRRGFIQFLLLGVMLLLAVGAWYSLGGLMQVTEGDTTEKSEPKRPSEPQRSMYAWIFTDLGSDEFGMPRTRVEIEAGENKYNIGDFDGSCAEQNTDLLPDEKKKVVCWWAGGGNEIGIFDEEGRDVVKVGELSEGDAETPGFRGNFKTKQGL